MKVDVEGHEVAVLDGARAALRAGRVHAILLEYGDKMTPAIYDAMKAQHSAHAAAPSPQHLKGLRWLRGYADSYGYDVFLLGATRGRPVLVGVSGELWDDDYEACDSTCACACQYSCAVSVTILWHGWCRALPR